jgi:hypothetical protein
MSTGEPDDRLVNATRFALSGDGVEVEHLAGDAPELRYRAGDSERVFVAAELRVERVSLGTLVTATIESVPDLGDVTLTLAVPDVNLREDASATVTAFLVRTRHRTSIGGPALVDGALQSYEIIALAGTAMQSGDGAGACRDWLAIHDLEPPGPGRLRVTARCVMPTPGHRVELRRKEPQGFNPRDLLLEKLVHEPAAPAAQVLTEVDVEYGELSDARIDTVTILPDAVSIPVQAAL